MRLNSSLRFGVTWLAVCNMCLPTTVAFGATPPAVAEQAPKPGSMMSDVALAPGGLLVGQILDDTLQPIRGATVQIQVDGITTAETTSDKNGVFAVSGLRGGIHQIVTQDATETCRLWAPGTAPPRAVENLRFVPGNTDVVRGQWGPPVPSYDSLACQAKALATNPFVVGGVIAAAIGIPIWLANQDDDDSGS